jgi:hypothetical protein
MVRARKKGGTMTVEKKIEETIEKLKSPEFKAREAEIRFGIRQGQMRGNQHVHNGSWYDRDGLKIGWGDLSKDDIFRIAYKIPDDDVFYVVGEHDSYWNAPEGGLTLEMVKDLARFIITACKVTVTKRWLSRLNTPKSFSTLEEYEAELAPRISPRDVVKI